LILRRIWVGYDKSAFISNSRKKQKGNVEENESNDLVFASNSGIYSSKTLNCDHQGEKLLNNLGGMFSKPWKPKKTKAIQGPVTTPGFFSSSFTSTTQKFWFFSSITIMECGVWTDKPSKKDVTNKEDREKLGLAPLPKGRSAPTTPPNESSTTYDKLDVCVLLCFVMLCYAY